MKSVTNVGDDIEKTEGEWIFDDDVADQFDKHIRNSIQNYSVIQSHIVKLANWFMKTGGEGTIYDLGCATGTTIQKIIKNREEDDNYTFVGIDESRAMIEVAEQKIQKNEKVRLIEDDLSIKPQFPNADLIISLFTMSFLPEPDRRELINVAYRDLNHGGALIFVEKTYPKYSRFQSLFQEHYYDYKINHFTAEEILNKSKSLRGQLRPLTTKEYRDTLQAAGFEEIQPWYRQYMWWGVIARKQ